MDKEEYQQKEKRQRQNSKPSHSPDEAELAKLMGFLDHELALTSHYIDRVIYTSEKATDESDWGSAFCDSITGV